MPSRNAPRSSARQFSAAIVLSLLGVVPSLSCDSDVSDQPSTASEQSGLTLGPVNVLTRNYNNQRTGANLSETILNASNVNASQFGKLFQVAVDDQVYAGVLYASQVPIGGVNRNVIYVATVNNSVYAFDADIGGPPLWQRNFNGTGRPTTHTEVGMAACGNNYVDFSGNIGIVGTPVIDAGSGVMFFVTRTVESSGTVQRLRAINIIDGTDRSGNPAAVVIGTAPGNGTNPVSAIKVAGTGDGSSGGNVTFNATNNNQRPALALSSGIIYVGWSSFCDQGPYQGWLVAFDSNSLSVTGKLATTPNGGLGGIWMGGAAPVVDSAGAIYVATGNGTWDGNTNFGETLLKLAPSSLSRTDYFTAGNFAALNSADNDLASAGPLILPGLPTSIVTGSKEGKVYLMNTGNMGHMVSGDTQIAQWFQAVNTTIVNSTHHIHNTPVAWQSPAGLNLFVWGENDFLRAYRFSPTTAKFGTTPFASGTKLPPLGMPGGIMTISANGSTTGSGVLWAVTPLSGDANHMVVPGVMYAFNGETLAMLFDSSTIADNDMGNLAKYNPPVTANGKVYVASFSNLVSAYGQRTLVPFGGAPVSLPGAIEAENFDYGGEGLAYHDSDTANQGGAYRKGGVDLQAASEGAFNVGWTVAGEWLKYSVAITGGNYNISARIASMAGGGSFRVELEDGTDLTGAIAVPSTGAWTTWATVSKNNVNLPAGNHVLRVFEIVAGFNLNNLTFALNAPTCTTAADCNDNNPCTVDACNTGSCTHVAGNAGTVCRATAGACDQAELCSGSSTACPIDTFLAASTVCRAAAGVCDQAESCTGSSAACPTDTFLNPSTVCRAAVDLCDQAETCTGSSAACPADGIKSSGTVCRAAVGTCDTAETCNGTSTACPADAILPVGTTCRAVTGACDVAETCTGTSGVCPTDVFVAGGTVCRASAGVCDQAESCTGSSAACPTDTFLGASTVCRAAVDLCDQAESCTGSSAACPVDGLKAAGTVCRAAANQCDAAETCNGSSTACPPDAQAPNGTSCNDGNSGTCSDVCTAGVCGGTTCSSQAFGGTPRSITTTIQAEDYDIGGEGAGYHDTTAGNQGGQYRTDNVDIEATTDTNGGFNVGFVAAGEWMNYSVTVATGGSYKMSLRVATMSAGQTMHVEVDGANVTGAITVPNTAGWQTWQTATQTLKAYFTAGNHVVRVVFDTLATTNGGINLNWLTFVANPGPSGGTVRSMTSTIQAEDFDLGGEAIGYHDSETANQGGQYRTTEGVDIEATTDTGGGFNVGWTAAGEWMAYTVSNTATVTAVNVRVADTAAQTMHVEVDGVNVSGTINLPNTTGWQTWQTVSKTLTTAVPAGTHIMRVVFDSTGPNLNWISFN
ncbi:MAG TPA: carbohydrate-binding protein [Polyangia bacterium]